MKNSNDKKEVIVKIARLIGNVIYFGILIPLIIMTLMVVYQTAINPEKVPNVFGHKIFMITNDYMDETLKQGDIVIAKTVEINEYEIGDIVAFKNSFNTVTVHRITEINTSIADKTKLFTVQTIKNETDDTKYVREINVEGKIIHVIPKVGTMIASLKNPIILAITVAVILFVGVLIYLIARKIDHIKTERYY